MSGQYEELDQQWRGGLILYEVIYTHLYVVRAGHTASVLKAIGEVQTLSVGWAGVIG